MSIGPKQPTMMDVARLAGVSPMTVSRALKPNTSVSNATREKIRKAADELGYVLDSTAAGLSSRRTGFIAVTIPSINNANFADTLRGLTQVLRETNMQVLLGYTDYDVAEEERLVEQFLRRRPEAMIVTGHAHTHRCRRMLEKCGVPVVEMWDLPEHPIDQVVGFSNAYAAKLMVDHFVAQGYRKIGFIGGDPSRDTRGQDRRQGFRTALQNHGLDASRMVAEQRPPITMREGAHSMRIMLEKWPDTEALMCVSDLSAFGAMTECQRQGLRVPDDIAIGGFGAYDLSEQSLPPITTIDVSSEAIGRIAAEVIQNLLSKDLTRDMETIHRIEPRLLVRDSSRRRIQGAGTGQEMVSNAKIK